MADIAVVHHYLGRRLGLASLPLLGLQKVNHLVCEVPELIIRLDEKLLVYQPSVRVFLRDVVLYFFKVGVKDKEMGLDFTV